MYLDGNGGVEGVVTGDDNIISQNDDVVLDFFRNALGTGSG